MRSDSSSFQDENEKLKRPESNDFSTKKRGFMSVPHGKREIDMNTSTAQFLNYNNESSINNSNNSSMMKISKHPKDNFGEESPEKKVPINKKYSLEELNKEDQEENEIMQQIIEMQDLGEEEKKEDGVIEKKDPIEDLFTLFEDENNSPTSKPRRHYLKKRTTFFDQDD